MTVAIAIVGMACQYPDASSPVELWENVLAQRRAFRRIPSERLSLSDYFSADRSDCDRTYLTEAALIEGYEFDRVRFRVAGSTFRAADLVHWLALDIADRAFQDAGFPAGEGLPLDATGVLLGNTLTGEFSRANLVRLRWPYVRRVVEAELQKTDWPAAQRLSFLENLETQYKAPFPPFGDESLAGGLANTIAGRICNHFNLKGGGYTVDGACSSSLLAVAQACSALVAGDLDVALAGGVDLSLDPFELVGFARVGALASDEMRVYDARSAGFWPGEGCGAVVLMRQEEALAQHRHIYAVIRGWGISSDGSGGITRPEVEGQLLALKRAYRRAGFAPATVAYFEGHGTGTSVGDATELQVLSRARREADVAELSTAAIGSIKANIGHTKAAAGVAGLIKASMALQAQILPPTTGCDTPHPLLTEAEPALRVLATGETWPTEMPLRVGVSAMGFGGINTHIVLEGAAAGRRQQLATQERHLLASAQDAELFLLGSDDRTALEQQVDRLLDLALRLSRSELTDLAAQLAQTLMGNRLRVAIVATNPMVLHQRLETLKSWLAKDVKDRLDIQEGIFLGSGPVAPRIGFLFPGQGVPANLSGGAFCRRFETVQALYQQANLPIDGDGVATAVAQPAIVTASMAGLRLLNALELKATVAIGLSLGELNALHWAGTYDEATLLRIATARGQAMTALGSSTGAMASLRADQQAVERLIGGDPVTIAGINSPRHTVIAGEAGAIATVVARAEIQGIEAIQLPVSHAFHSPLVAAAAQPLAQYLLQETFQPVQRRVISTVTGKALTAETDLRSLLRDQVTQPVRFLEAIAIANPAVDLWIEVGPGHVLSSLVRANTNATAIPLDAGGPSLQGLLKATGAAYTLGSPINPQKLFINRFARPFDLNKPLKFFANPCEQAPQQEDGERKIENGGQKKEAEGWKREEDEGWKLEEKEINSKFKTQNSKLIASPASSAPSASPASTDPLDLVRQLVSARAELPVAAIDDNSRLLSDLHLNSITVGQLVAEAARALNLTPPASPTHYADASVTEVAQALEEIAQTGGADTHREATRSPAGADTWIRPFTISWVERPLRQPKTATGTGSWQVIAPPDLPLAAAIQALLDQQGMGNGVLLCLPPNPDERHLSLLLESSRTVLAEPSIERFVLVQSGGGAAAFARTLYLEQPNLTVCVVDVPMDVPQASQWVLAEAQAAVGYTEACYDTAGRRQQPILKFLPWFDSNRSRQTKPESAHADRSNSLLLTAEDVLLVTGGGKGITAECAFSLARETGSRLVLLGRSQPEQTPELAANLDRMTAAGVRLRYLAADVTDAAAVRAAIEPATADFGPITAILHGAGINPPRLLSVLDEATFRQTLAAKVQGLQNILAAVNPERLRLLVSFGSIIARTGLPGEAHYGLANEWLTRLTGRFQQAHPCCRCLSVEWSVWSGVGMGARLGSVEALEQQGITPIPPDAGIEILHRLLAQPLPATAIVVTGRFGEPPTIDLDLPELPFLRFLEQPKVHYPGVELVMEAELSLGSDPYLNDHRFQGERVFPAVLGLEAMVQVVQALTGSNQLPRFEDVKFNRPIVVPADAPTTLRIAALAQPSGQIEVVLRSEDTAFQVDCFRAICWMNHETTLERLAIDDLRLTIDDSADDPANDSGSAVMGYQTCLPLDPKRDLYGDILFHQGRFQRLSNYRHLRAKECRAEIAPDRGSRWFSAYLPGDLVLGDPGARDAAIHALQACIPQATILPIGVEKLTIRSAHPSGPRFVQARERAHIGNRFIYDLAVTDADGLVLERWDGLELQAVDRRQTEQPWAALLLGPYLERRIEALIPTVELDVVLEQDAMVERRLRCDRALKKALNAPVAIHRRPDGKPEVADGCRALSAAHADDLTLAVAGSGPLGCDLEPVAARSPQLWRDLLGAERFALAAAIAKTPGETDNSAATRVWAASECLKKAGALETAPLVLDAATDDSWVMLTSGSMQIATVAVAVKAREQPLVLAVLVTRPPAAPKESQPKKHALLSLASTEIPPGSPLTPLCQRGETDA